MFFEHVILSETRHMLDNVPPTIVNIGDVVWLFVKGFLVLSLST